MLELFIILFFPFLMAYAGASDMVSMTISNKISIALIAAFPVVAWSIGMDVQTMAWHFAAFGLVMLVGFLLFIGGFLGGGDAKLAAVAALWIGWALLPQYFVLFAFLGAGLSLFLLSIRNQPLPERVTQVGWIGRLYSAKEGIPYGMALGAAAIMLYPKTPFMQHVFKMAAVI